MMGIAVYMGVEMEPTKYDHTPEQYMMRSKRESRHWNRGHLTGLNMI